MSKIILDSTSLYQPSADYIVITTEVEFITYFTLENDGYWLKGKRLCDWAKEYLRVWNKLDLITEEKQNPRLKLETILQPLSIPNNWNDQFILEIVTKLDQDHSENKVVSFLANLTNTNQEFWLTTDLSIKHLAQWLSIKITQEYQIFKDVWLNHLINNNHHDLLKYYQIENKEQLLKSWLGLNYDFNIIEELGKYPLDIPDLYLEEFKQFWHHKIYQTETKILNKLILPEETGNQIIANIAYDILLNNPSWITQEIITKISYYLNRQQISNLQQKLPPKQPLPLLIDATPEDTLKWVTEYYLPFRKWETTINITAKQEQISEKLADSFVNWLVKYYPELKLDNVEQSLLNYNVTAQVQKLAQENIIIWVVVDGLGWLDHQDLINILTEDHQLKLEKDITPRFSILPTKTEYAKWSLYAQLLPEDTNWKPNAKEGFSYIESGKRYTDHNKHLLTQDLQGNKFNIYCWDTDQLDKVYHQEKDWKTLYKVERINALESIARNIKHILAEYNHPEKLKIVIASDHGQIMGKTEKLTNSPEELQSKGRMAIGKTDNPHFMVLSAKSFGLPYDISVVKNSDCITTFNYTKDQEIIGSHGGLFPEEVVVGFSVLSKTVKRQAISIICEGEGTAKSTGELTIKINNPNLISLTNLCLYVNEISELKIGKMLDLTIQANGIGTHQISIKDCPELSLDNDGKNIKLSGKLTFMFANNEPEEVNLNPESVITITQIFDSGIQGGIDEFL
jgi:hypothetical protein